jgi:hypothetical protein
MFMKKQGLGAGKASAWEAAQTLCLGSCAGLGARLRLHSSTTRKGKNSFFNTNEAGMCMKTKQHTTQCPKTNGHFMSKRRDFAGSVLTDNGTRPTFLSGFRAEGNRG